MSCVFYQSREWQYYINKNYFSYLFFNFQQLFFAINLTFSSIARLTQSLATHGSLTATDDTNLLMSFPKYIFLVIWQSLRVCFNSLHGLQQKPAVRPLPALATPTFRPITPTAQPPPPKGNPLSVFLTYGLNTSHQTSKCYTFKES